MAELIVVGAGAAGLMAAARAGPRFRRWTSPQW